MIEDYTCICMISYSLHCMILLFNDTNIGLFVSQLTEKIQTLEKSLSHMSREFSTEKRTIVQQARTENEAAKIELAKLQRVIDLKTREMNKVKRLAKNILDQRTELERFFLESLEQVRNEINANQ